MTTMDYNKQVLAALTLSGARLMADWHYKALPNGEYAQTIDEMKAAYPDAEDELELREGVNPFTGRPCVQVRNVRLRQEMQTRGLLKECGEAEAG